MSWSVENFIDRLTHIHPYTHSLPLPTPPLFDYDPMKSKVALAVASMKDHITDEGWQIMEGLRYSGYELAGYDIETRGVMNVTNVLSMIKRCDPGVVLVQDKREWDAECRTFRDPKARFVDYQCLRQRDNIFKLTILKDAHQRVTYHMGSAEEMGVHGWVIYYHPTLVKYLAPYVRTKHLIRTYHTIDPNIVPTYTSVDREGCILSGAVSNAYPLRQQILVNLDKLPSVYHHKHPGYNRNGCHTSKFLQTLSKFKVAICTSSIYGYALRKIVEATAAGCVVITDLPRDDILPHIDGNLVRVDPNIEIVALNSIIMQCLATYNCDRQYNYSQLTKDYYDYRFVTLKLCNDINEMALLYNN